MAVQIFQPIGILKNKQSLDSRLKIFKGQIKVSLGHWPKKAFLQIIDKQSINWEVVVTLFVERLLSISEVRGLTPVIGKIYIEHCWLVQLYWKDKNKLKEAGNGPLLKKVETKLLNINLWVVFRLRQNLNQFCWPQQTRLFLQTLDGLSNALRWVGIVKVQHKLSTIVQVWPYWAIIWKFLVTILIQK